MSASNKLGNNELDAKGILRGAGGVEGAIPFVAASPEDADRTTDCQELTRSMAFWISKNRREAEHRIEQVAQTGAKELDLFNLRLTQLPESIGQLTQIQSLNVSLNRLTTLPEFICRLTELQNLVVSSNEFAELPEFIGRLSQLQRLELRFNKLTTLPESIGQLVHLQSLDASVNGITALPQSIGQLIQLQSLSLYSNRLRALPESIGKLAHLQIPLSPSQSTDGTARVHRPTY